MNLINKKTSVLIMILFCLAAKLSATGAGIQAGGNPGLFINEENIKIKNLTGRLTGTIRFSRIPMTVGFGFESGKTFSDFSYGLYGFADYYAVDTQIKNTWNFYSGFGAEGSLLTPDFTNWTASAGARFFAGMNWLFYDNYIEFYIQQNAVPTLIKILNSDSTACFTLNLPFETGIRMHF